MTQETTGIEEIPKFYAGGKALAKGEVVVTYKDHLHQLQKARVCEKELPDGSICGCKLDCHLHDWRQREELQEAREEWLRSEIEKLEEQMVAKGNYNCGEEGCCNPNPKYEREKEDFEWQIGYNQALTSIITRYKEELKVLTGE